MNWFFLAIGSALNFSALSLLSRLVSVKSKNPRAMSFVFNLTAIAMSLIIFFAVEGHKKFVLPNRVEPYLFLSIPVLFYGLFERLRFYATKALEASHLTIVNNVSLLVAVTIAFFLYSEKLTLNYFIGFLLIITALLLVSLDKISVINWKGVMIGVIANVMLGIGWALDKKMLGYFNTETYNLFAWLFPLIILYLPSLSFSEIKKEFKLSSWKIVLLAFFNVAGYFLNLKALILADATRVFPVAQTSTIFTVIFGIILLKEKKFLIRKIFAGVIAVIGVYLLV
jgi:drug/metabolite transporter (DMT)-like permease